MLGILLVFAVSPWFLFKLGQMSLVSWDEAWYAEIAKQILLGKDLWVMHFNQAVFTDHPPMGFWLIALGQKIFGANEFGSRILSSVVGLLTVWFVYLLGKALYNKLAGFCAAFSLATSPWFLYRSRTGNLDIFLTFFFVTTIYFAWKARTNRVYVWPFLLMLVSLLLTKTMVPLTVFPVLVIIFWGVSIYRWWEILLGVILVLFPLGLWVQANMAASEIFLTRYFSIGLPGVGQRFEFLPNLAQVKTFFYNGFGKWFWYGMLGMVGSLVRFKRAYFVPVVAAVSIMLPFLFSSRGQIWHMIPAYPFVHLALFGFLIWIASFVPFKFVRLGLVLGFAGMIGIGLMVRNWTEFVDTQRYISDEQILAQKAAGYPGILYLDDDSVPAVVFYSNKKVIKVLPSLADLVKQEPKPFLLITRDWRLLGSGLSPRQYEILAKDRDKLLIRVIQ